MQRALGTLRRRRRLGRGRPRTDSAHARTWWIRALVAEGDRVTATAAIRDARTIAEHLGAVPLIEEIGALARSARLSLEDAAAVAETPHGLTDRETEVLALVGRGLTNAQIGSQLFMSPKTASVHVSRLIAKLGVANRTEAAAQAQRLGLIPD